MTEEERSNRPRKAVGPERQIYFNQGDVDRVMAVLLALISDVAAIRDRLDTHERLGSAGQLPSLEAVEAYLPDAVVDGARDVWRDAYIRRLFRVITEDVEALKRAAGDVG